MRRRGFLAGGAAFLPGLALADTGLLATVPPGTALTIGDPLTQHALMLAGKLNTLPFQVNWANIAGGPQTTQAIRASALDLGSVANIPPIWAYWTGLDVKISAVWERQDPLNHPIYKLGVAPGANVRSIADLRGKRIAYAPGQAQGVVILHALHAAGIPVSDVQLIQMPSTANVYVNALASRQVDVAPIGEVFAKRYLTLYGKDGATTIDHGQRDDIMVIYGPTATLKDPAKAAAVNAFVQVWARAIAWVNANPQAWVQGYYEQFQRLDVSDAQDLVQEGGKSLVPASWDEVIAIQQQTIELMAPVAQQKPFDAALLFDRRFEQPAAAAFAGAG